MPDATPRNVRLEAHRLIDALPENATWEDVMYHVYVRECVDAGIDDANAGRVIDIGEVRQQFGLTP